MYRRKIQGWVKHLDFILIDLFSMYLALFMAYLIRHDSWRILDNEYYREILLPLFLLNITFDVLSSGFKNVLRRGTMQELWSSVKQAAMVQLGLLFYLYIMKISFFYSRQILIVMGAFYVLFTYLFRTIWKVNLQSRMRNKPGNALVIVTTQVCAPRAISNMRQYNYERNQLAGLILLDIDYRGMDIDGVPVVATERDAAEYICREWVDEVLIVLPQRGKEETKSKAQIAVGKLVKSLHQMGVVVHTVLSERDGTQGIHQYIEKFGNYNVITSSINYAGSAQLSVKRLLDIVGGIVGCLLTFLLMIFLAPAIYIKSPGPIFYAQTRVGRNGRQFKIYKFRSMYVDADQKKKDLMKDNRVEDDRMFKLDWDPRIIGSRVLPDGTKKKGIGNFMRDYSLDEFPQFFNVLKGEMSLVGTRPPTVDEWEKYEPWHRMRLAVKPGITGLWQVSGRSRITDFEEVVRLDTQYINRWSLGLDVKILMKTVKVVLTRDGAM